MGDHLLVGAGVTHWMLEFSEMVASKVPALSQTFAVIGDIKARNRNTLGGAITLIWTYQGLLHGPLGNISERVSTADRNPDFDEFDECNFVLRQFSPAPSLYPYAGSGVTLSSSGGT